MFCRTADLLHAALPLRPFRDWLIRSHMEGCPRCQARLLSREEARGLLVAPDRVGDAGALWRRIAAAADRTSGLRDERPSPSGVALKWASVAAMALVIAVAGFWLLRQSERPGLGVGAVVSAARFEIAYVDVGGAPAQTFVYQPQGSDTVFVWAQKARSGG